MNAKTIRQIFRDTAYIRTGGSPQELRCAQFLQAKCAELGLSATLESFPVAMARDLEAQLEVDGLQIPCKGYLCAGSGQVEAPFYYLANKDACSLQKCRGRIVLIDGYLGAWVYRDLVDNGALGFITYDGSCFDADRDMDQRELRSYVHQGTKLPGVHINAKDAVRLVAKGARSAKLSLLQREYQGVSHNVCLELPGTDPDTILFTAHYDSTALSQGAYDNMSGSIGLLAIAEYFAAKPHRCTLRFVWCGSEERGLLGSKAYCQAHEDELDRFVLNINLDMIGCIMGKSIACCTSEEKLVHYLQYMSQELGHGMHAYQDVYSSDSTPFADRGIPAVSFARAAPGNTASIHNRHDTAAVIRPAHMQADISFILAFAQRMANAARCPVAREIPEKMKEKLDIYLLRKRDKS